VSISNINIEELKKKSFQVRRDILNMTNKAASGHPGGSLSAVEILLCLYECKLKHKPQEPSWDNRDKVIISKGHITPVVYSVLARSGYFSIEQLQTFRKFKSILQGHVHTKVPGVEFNTGSLGQGLSVANGVAMGAKMKGKDTNVYCLMGDGEIQEGSIWEAAMTAAHHKIDNVCAIVDYNKIQENGFVSDIKGLEPLSDKWRSFGWHVEEVNGHNFSDLKDAFDAFDKIKEKPFVLIAHTIKGKGVSFMEGKNQWHGKAPNAEQLQEALKELDK